ncbi:MAG TPA: hypothetical protein V6C96_03915, partial [Vampirovibrionales bacterium]
LKLLATQEIPEDKEDQIKGYALKAVWSEHLSATELFQVLTPPKNANFFGGYKSFFNLFLVQNIQQEDLPIALDWLEMQGIRGFGHPFNELGDQLVLKAWENLDLPGVIKALIRVAFVQWRKYQGFLIRRSKYLKEITDFLPQEVEKRHRLIEYIVFETLELEEDDFWVFAGLEKELIYSDDFPWLLEKLQSSNSGNIQKIWSQLLQRTFNSKEVKQVDALLIATQNNQILRGFLTPYFEAIELNSTQAEKLKSDYLKMQEMEDNRKNICLLDPPPKIRVLQQLEQFEAGNLSAWWQINIQMQLKPESEHYYEHDLELDFSKLPGWQEAEDNTKTRIVEAAKRYVCEQNEVS